MGSDGDDAKLDWSGLRFSLVAEHTKEAVAFCAGIQLCGNRARLEYDLDRPGARPCCGVALASRERGRVFQTSAGSDPNQPLDVNLMWEPRARRRTAERPFWRITS